jgi:ATP adenylyltransferase
LAKSKPKPKPKSKGRHPSKPHRQVIFAPWRHTYIKRAQSEQDECVFCEALAKGKSFESLIVYRGETCSVILNKFPYNNGHTMIIPNRHTAAFEKLSSKEHDEIHRLLKRSLEALQEAYQPQGFNLGMNLGRVGGAGIIDHLHYHIVPRWTGDTNFMPLIGETKVVSEGLEETYKKLVPLFI